MTDRITDNNRKVFAGGKSSFEEASNIAAKCGYFTEDCEDELYCDDEISCYNCRYRRWTADSFECMKR